MIAGDSKAIKGRNAVSLIEALKISRFECSFCLQPAHRVLLDSKQTDWIVQAPVYPYLERICENGHPKNFIPL